MPTGDELKNDIENLQIIRRPLIEDFMYEGRVTMISADPEVGKSLVCTQIAMSLTRSGHLFNYFAIPKARNVYYAQTEGAYDETVERIRYLREVLHVDYHHLYWDNLDDGPLNVRNPSSVGKFMDRIHRWKRNPELVVLDPIYMCVPGGDLKEGAVSTSITNFCERLKKTFKTAILIVHHTHRERYSSLGKVIEERDPYYGSQWLKAYVDTSYHLRRSKHGGVELVNKKARGGDVKSYIDLSYDPETFLNTVSGRSGGPPLPADTRILEHLRRCLRLRKDTDFRETVRETGISEAHVRRVQRRLIRAGDLEVISNGSKKKIWKPNPRMIAEVVSGPGPITNRPQQDASQCTPETSHDEGDRGEPSPEEQTSPNPDSTSQ